MGLRFTPPKGSARYALFVEGDNQWNRTNFRTYDTLGSAKNGYHSVYSKTGAKILEMVEGEWFVLFDIPAGTKREDLPWYRDVTEWGASYSYSSRTVKRAKPMTRDEYAAWRLSVEKERASNVLSSFLTSRLPVPGLNQRDHANA